VKAILDMKKDICYVQIPELNKDYLSAEVASGYGDLSDLNELFKTLSDVYEKTPDQEKVAKILKRYAEVAIKDVENVTRSKKKVNAGNLSNACTVLTVSMTDRELRKLCKDVIKAMRDDDELKEIIKETGSAIPNVSGSEAWDAFRDALSKVETAVDSIDEDVEFSMYVTNKGEIVGRSMEVDGVELSSVTLTKGKKYASDTSLSGKGTHVELEGNGTKSSGVINADFEVSYKGGSFEFSLDDFDQNSWENGILKGGISFEIGDIIRSLGISYWVPSEVNLFKSMRLGLMLDTTKGNNSMDITLYDDKDPMATLRAKETKTQLSSVDIPSKSYSSDDNTEWKDWIRDADYHEILDRLDKAGLPSSLLHQIEQWAQWSFNIN
jgi:RNA binding exosome subunit